uniref:Methyltransferase type 11 domain-containing protein n=1 Tax=Globodera rostochiensis TaxID=31243 RepID=A0A914H663_GLORO
MPKRVHLRINFCGDSGSTAKVYILAPGDKLPFTNDSVDFVISAHALEHFWDPIKAIKEWLRVVKAGGYVYMDVPHKERTFERVLPRTPLAELLDRHAGKLLPTNPTEDLKPERHKSVWITEDLLELCKHFNWNVVKWRDVDDKVGNGFTIVIKK